MKVIRRLITMTLVIALIGSLCGAVVARTTTPGWSSADMGPDSATSPPADTLPESESPASDPPADLPETGLPATDLPEPEPPVTEIEPTTPPASVGPMQPWFHLPNGRRDIILTFDDGPSQYTRAILEILAAEQVDAAFFWVAGQDGLEMATEVIAHGHQLATHTVGHVNLAAMGRPAQQAELAASVAMLETAGRQNISFMRPPYGAWNEDTLQAAQELGLATILWNVDSQDWALPGKPDQIIANVLEQVHEGAIILLHERAQTVEALPQLIRALRAQGYTFGLL